MQLPLSARKGPRRSAVRIAKFMIRLREQGPDRGLDPARLEYLQLVTGRAGQRRPGAHRQVLRGQSELRYEQERLAPFHSYFGPHDIRQHIEGKIVLEFGPECGGMTRGIVESMKPAGLTGVDVESDFVDAASDYFRDLGLAGTFRVYGGDRLPFEDAVFDTVYTFDVLNAVRDLPLTIRECFRILRPGGRLLAVFPGFYHPKSHYLNLVTGTPCVHYFFSRETLERAYEEILDERGESARWYRRERPGFEPWERSFMTNGITKRRFRRVALEAGFAIELDHPLALGETGQLRRRRPVLALVVPIFKLLARLPGLEEVFTHRVVMILRRPPAG
jgi:SAM-dependent methyltransferase